MKFKSVLRHHVLGTLKNQKKKKKKTGSGVNYKQSFGYESCLLGDNWSEGPQDT